MKIFKKYKKELGSSNKIKKPFKKWQKITLGVCGGFVALIVISVLSYGNNNKSNDVKVAEVTTASTTSTEATTTTAETTTTTQEPETTTTIQETTSQHNEPVSERHISQTQATYDHSDAKEYTYILNTSTHKFHYSGCSSVSKIKPSNYRTFTGTREQAISNGYSPCKKCNP